MSIRDLAESMLGLALSLPAFREAASRVRMVEVAGAAYYGAGYQDMQYRVPDIRSTVRDLGWSPGTGMQQALAALFEACAAEAPKQ